MDKTNRKRPGKGASGTAISDSNHSTFALDSPVGWIEPTDPLHPKLTRRDVLEKIETLSSDTTTKPEKARWLIFFEWCKHTTLYWPDGVGVTIPDSHECITDQAIYAAYLKGREYLESVHADAQRRYQASLVLSRTLTWQARNDYTQRTCPGLQAGPARVDD